MDYFILYFFWGWWGKNGRQWNMTRGSSRRGWQGRQSQGRGEGGRGARSGHDTIWGWRCIDSNWRNHCLSRACQTVLRQFQLPELQTNAAGKDKALRTQPRVLSALQIWPTALELVCIQALEAVLPVSLRTWVSNLHTYSLQGLCIRRAVVNTRWMHCQPQGDFRYHHLLLG